MSTNLRDWVCSFFHIFIENMAQGIHIKDMLTERVIVKASRNNDGTFRGTASLNGSSEKYAILSMFICFLTEIFEFYNKLVTEIRKNK